MPILWEGTGAFARKTHVYERGNWMVKGAEVQPGVPRLLPPLPTGFPQNRLGLARWIVHRENPLTARVIVNRFWEQLFGRGIVETVEDFGSQGSEPSHRELLDWLAVSFMEDDQWSVKKLLKKIVLSATYQQSSRSDLERQQKDPHNEWLSHGPRVRLSAEQVRDQALASTGLLSAKMYGPSVMPPQPDGIWQSPYNGDKWVTSEGENRYRRSLYTYWKRTAPYPSMITFDAPEPGVLPVAAVDYQHAPAGARHPERSGVPRSRRTAGCFHGKAGPHSGAAIIRWLSAHHPSTYSVEKPEYPAQNLPKYPGHLPAASRRSRQSAALRESFHSPTGRPGGGGECNAEYGSGTGEGVREEGEL